MKSALIAIVALATALLLISCSDDKAGSHTEVAATSEDTSADAPEAEAHSAAGGEPAGDGLGLALNDGSKWEMDEHTRGVFTTMATSYLASDHRSLDEETLMKAGAGLQSNINELIQGCTMDGAAHDQLHVYLMGYMPAVAALEKGGQMADADKVALYLETYNEYFE